MLKICNYNPSYKFGSDADPEFRQRCNKPYLDSDPGFNQTNGSGSATLHLNPSNEAQQFEGLSAHGGQKVCNKKCKTLKNYIFF